MTWKKW